MRALKNYNSCMLISSLSIRKSRLYKGLTSLIPRPLRSSCNRKRPGEAMRHSIWVRKKPYDFQLQLQIAFNSKVKYFTWHLVFSKLSVVFSQGSGMFRIVTYHCAVEWWLEKGHDQIGVDLYFFRQDMLHQQDQHIHKVGLGAGPVYAYYNVWQICCEVVTKQYLL